ncbi:hypothetical protein [Kitasatospora indigofera]|uniref:hypothetical protein n=1 Tax=Kitasatospora indigofera TaxID=67307 RepID=UPI0036739090
MITVLYELADDLNDGEALDIVEDRGRVVYRLRDSLTPQEMVDVLNTGTAGVIAGGRWFQEWKGDIISAEATDSARHLPAQRAVHHDVAETDEA